MRIILGLAILALFTTCGKFERLPSGQTAVSFRVEGHSPTALLPGIMVYAVRANDVNSRGARYLPSEVAGVSWAIPNGVYHFYAIGYHTAGMQGAMYCGSALNRPLSGGSVVIPLVIDDQNKCGLPPFSPTGYEYDANIPKFFALGVCASSGGDISATQGLTITCNGGGGAPASDTFYSYRVNFGQYNRWDPSQPVSADEGAGLSTGCVSATASGSSPATSSLALPFGEIFVANIEVFSSAACAGYAGSYTMTKGMIGAGVNESVRFRNASDVIVTPGVQAMKASTGGVLNYIYLRRL